MFDMDGNILMTNCSSMLNSLNHSAMLNNMLLQTHGMPPTHALGSIYKNSNVSNNRKNMIIERPRGGGPQANISPPILNFRMQDDDTSIKPTCSSQGPPSTRRQ